MPNLTALTVHAYDIATGAHLSRLPYTACSWTDSINEPGSMSVSIDYSLTAVTQGIRDMLKCWRVILAVQRGAKVLHAGPLTDFDWDAETRRLSLTCGGGLTLLTKRLAINARLKDAWNDRSVLTDEQHAAGDLAFTLTGSYPDIIRGLVAEAMRWGTLPISLPATEGGSYTRTWYAWDLATIADRIQDITSLEDGPETRFDPRTADDGSLVYDLRCASEIMDHAWRWNAIVPGQRVIYQGLSGDGSSMTSQVWLTGGKDDDKTLMCRRTSGLDTTGMLLMTADTSHTTVSYMKTLQQCAIGGLERHAWPAETHKLKVGEEHDVRVGDTIDLTIGDDYMGVTTLNLRATDISGDASSDWLTVQAQERTE